MYEMDGEELDAWLDHLEAYVERSEIKTEKRKGSSNVSRLGIYDFKDELCTIPIKIRPSQGES